MDGKLSVCIICQTDLTPENTHPEITVTMAQVVNGIMPFGRPSRHPEIHLIYAKHCIECHSEAIAFSKIVGVTLIPISDPQRLKKLDPVALDHEQLCFEE